MVNEGDIYNMNHLGEDILEGGGREFINVEGPAGLRKALGLKRRKFVKNSLMVFIALACLSTNPLAYADPYFITAEVTNLGTNSWNFEYEVTNNNQGQGPLVGLDGFAIQVPTTAVISNITYPSSYLAGGYWAGMPSINFAAYLGSLAPLKNGYQWFGWWGYDPASVYPVGTTALFSFQINGVTVTTSPDATVTFWGPYTYTAYQAYLLGPGALAVPLQNLGPCSP